jgi:hypothetical protein
MSRRLKWVMLAAILLIVPVGASAWYLLRTEDIPETLPPVELDPDAIEIAATGDGPPLRLADLRGKTAFFVVVGTQTAKSPEGERLNRALNRWQYPDTTVGYVIGDAAGFGLFRDRIVEVMGHFATEVRYPLYVDYDGAFIETFRLPKGHHAFVAIGPDGEVLERRSGGIDDPAEIDRVRELLGAREPPPGPEVPDFTLGRLSDEACRALPCAIVFTGGPVQLSEVPGHDKGFKGDDDERYRQMLEPRIRNVQLARRMHLQGVLGTVVGEVDPALTFVGWDVIAQADDVRDAFEIPASTAAIVVIADGRIAMRETGLVPLYRWGVAADLLRVVGFNDRRPPKE